MGQLFENSKVEQALRANNTSFWTILNRDATTASRHSSPAAGAADTNAWASTLHKMAHDDVHAGTSEDQTCKTSMRKDCSVDTLSREELRSLIQIEEKSAFECAQRKEMGSMSQTLGRMVTFDVFTTGYNTAT